VAADIDIVIGAQDRASAVINGVAAKASGFGSSISSMLTPKMAALTGAIAGAAAGFLTLKAAIGAVSEASTRIDGLTDKAAGLGEAVGDLQAFQFAMAEAGDIDAGKSIQALQRIQKVVGEIATGGNAAGGAVFEQLAIDANALSMKGPIDQFNAVREALAKIENTSERAAMAQKLLGKSAADLMPALMAQTGEFEASMQAATDLGLVVSEEGAAGVASMNDAIGRASAGLEGMANVMAVQVAPLVESIATNIASWAPPAIELANVWLPSIVESMAALAGITVDVLSYMTSLVQLDFSQAFVTASNLVGEGGTAAKLITQVYEARARAEASAAANAAKMQAISAATRAADDAALKSRQAEVSEGEKLIAQLERKLAVQQQGAEAVERQEQLNAAGSLAELERIANLQAELDLHEQITAEFQSRVEAEKKATEERQRVAEQEQARRAELVSQIANVPTAVSATQSRLQTRGPAQSGMEKMTKLAEKQLAFLQKIFEKEAPKVQPLQLVQVN
jgi:hypothetical protein